MPPFLIKRRVKCGSNPQRLTKRKKEKENKMSAGENIMKQVNEMLETVDVPLEIYETTAKINYIYKEVLDKYMQTRAVIEFNLLEFIKQRTVHMTTKKEFDEMIEKAVADLSEFANISRTEKIELALLKRIQRDVVDGKGKLFDNEKITAKYDEQEVEFKTIDFLKGKIIQ